MKRNGVKNLGGLKREILRCPQMTNNRLLIALYMKITQWGGRPRPPTDMAARDGRSTNTSHFIVRWVRKEMIVA